MDASTRFFNIRYYQRLINFRGDHGKRISDGSVEKVVQKGDYLYFLTKDDKDKPIDNACNT